MVTVHVVPEAQAICATASEVTALEDQSANKLVGVC